MITEAELKALTDYISELEAENAFLRRERLFQVGGAQELLKAPAEPILGHTGPIPEGCGIGNAGQLICRTHEACRKYGPPGWFEARPVKRARKPDGNL
jgi:hypothetical protein